MTSRNYDQLLRETIRRILIEATRETRKKFHIPIPPDLLKISDTFAKAGKSFYLVGGAVRDALMGKTPKDLDVTTDALPDDIVSILKGDASTNYQILEIGKAFGVVKVITPDGNEYEIATFREDIGKGRRPDAVSFTSIEKDVSRRDLTMNALFYDIDAGEIVDFVGGIEDIERGVVRTVGEPSERFDEDRLRILRALRFAARVGSDLDPATAAAIKQNNALEGVSRERVRDEFLKGIKSAKSVSHFYDLISEFDLWPQIFPGLEVSTDLTSKNVMVSLGLLLRENQPAVLSSTLNRLKYSSEEIGKISYLVSFQDLEVDSAYILKKRYKSSRLTEEDLIEFSRILGMPSRRLVNSFISYEPSITATDLQAQGFSGRDIGAELARRETALFRERV